jgi:Domain of unknown function (DUF4345)
MNKIYSGMQSLSTKPFTPKKTLHLKISAIIILSIGVGYGLYPNNFFPGIFDFKAGSTDLKNIFRAIMGLYFGMVAVWLAGIIKPRLWVTATITNIAFMGGLAAGRLISLLADGLPSISLVLGLAGEIMLASWGVFNLRNYSLKATEQTILQ